MKPAALVKIIPDIYTRLFQRYGPQHWWPAKTRFEIIVGAILTQSAAWTNVEKAIDNLKKAKALQPEALRRLSQDALATLVRPSGYYNVKARKLKAFVEWLGDNYNDDLDKLFTHDIRHLRPLLFNIYGIGEETADSILLYAGNKPTFVVDAYTRRIMQRLGVITNNVSYAALQRIFMSHLPADAALFNEYHALLVKLGKDVCRTKPLCRQCCLNPAPHSINSHHFPCRKVH